MGSTRGCRCRLRWAFALTAAASLAGGAASGAILVAEWAEPGGAVTARFDRGWEEVRGALRLENGWLFARNDREHLFLLLDLTGDTVDDPPLTEAPWGDYLSVAFDLDLDGKISPNLDVAFATYPGTHRLGKQLYLRPGAFTGLQKTGAVLAAGFGSSPVLQARHRLWELAIPLAELRAKPGGLLRLGLKTHSVRPSFSDSLPADHARDFGRLLELRLAGAPAAFAVARVDPAALRKVALGQRIVVRPDLDALALRPVEGGGGRRPPGSGLPPGCSLPEGEPVSRAILPDGSVELKYANGSKKHRFQGGWQIFCPDGTRVPTMVLFSTQIPPTLPPTLPEPAEAQWLERHGEGLLGIIGTLVRDPAMVDTYLGTEGTDWNVYQRIQGRRDTIAYLLAE